MKIPMSMIVFPDYEGLMRAIRRAITLHEKYHNDVNISGFIEVVVDCRNSFTDVEYFISCINDNFGGVWYTGRDYLDLSLKRHLDSHLHDARSAYREWTRLCTTP
jgi:hypothetical protein